MTGKVFCVGLPRTGTRSLTAALEGLGFRAVHYLTFPGWLDADFPPAVLEGWDALLDTPAPVYFMEFDRRYPGSKFILSTRDTDAWLDSIRRHQEGPLPDSPLGRQRRDYRLLTYGMAAFSEARYRYVKETHERNVAWYFQDRPADLLTIDLCGGGGWVELCSFLGKEPGDGGFPHIT